MFDFGCCGSPLPRKETPNTQPQTVFEVFGYYVPYCTTLVQMEKGEKNKQAKSVRSYIFRDCTPMSYNENKNKPGTVRVWTINTVLPAQTCEKNTPGKKKKNKKVVVFSSIEHAVPHGKCHIGTAFRLFRAWFRCLAA